MNSHASNTLPTGKPLSAAELRKLPPEERDAILAAQAALAEAEYRTNADLTDFEAFGEEDMYGESSGAQPG